MKKEREWGMTSAEDHNSSATKFKNIKMGDILEKAKQRK